MIGGGILNSTALDCRRILFGVPGLPVSRKFEGQSFTPEAGVASVGERLDPVGSETETLGNRSGAMVGDTFIYAIDLWWPSAEPLGEDMPDALYSAREMAARIQAAFWHGRTVGGVEYQGYVRTAEVATPLESPGWLHFPIRVTLLVRRPVLVA